MAKGNKFYVVWIGREPGVYADWPSAKAQIEGYTGARYKGFADETEARQAFAEGVKQYDTRRRAAQQPTTERPILQSIAVDAACSGNPGKMEYRGVTLWDKKVIFHFKTALGTNNIGEFLAIVHALALLQQRNAHNITIYSDSQIAIGWVKRHRCRTKLEYTPLTAELFDLIKRAENWLDNNDFRVPIVKWPTETWGEIPADFGRK